MEAAICLAALWTLPCSWRRRCLETTEVLSLSRGRAAGLSTHLDSKRDRPEEGAFQQQVPEVSRWLQRLAQVGIRADCKSCERCCRVELTTRRFGGAGWYVPGNGTPWTIATGLAAAYWFCPRFCFQWNKPESFHTVTACEMTVIYSAENTDVWCLVT